MRSIQKALEPTGSGALSCAFPKTPVRSKSRTAAGELEGAGPASNEIDTESPRTYRFGGFLHPLFLLLRIQCTLACFCRRLRQSAIMAMNSEFVGLPLMFETV